MVILFSESARNRIYKAISEIEEDLSHLDPGDARSVADSLKDLLEEALRRAQRGL